MNWRSIRWMDPRKWIAVGHSIRVQILLSMLAMFALATLMAAAIGVRNGRDDVAIEIRSSMEFSERYVRELVRRIEAEGRLSEVEAMLSRELGELRHSRVYIQTSNSDVHPLPADRLSAGTERHAEAEPPAWFRALMMPKDANSQLRLVVVHDGKSTLLIKGDPDDEIAEKWQVLSEFGLLWLCVVGLLLLGFHFLLAKILGPLSSLSRGLTALEAGEREQRLPVPNLREVRDLAHKFNSLASSLDKARKENGQLYQQIMSVQEDERRHVARELHDEAGPCLFSITSNTESIDRIASELSETERRKLKDRAGEIMESAGRLKQINRALLRSLHPVSLSRVPITSLLEELIRDFERRNPTVLIHFASSFGAESFGEQIDLTIYRCIQEALTNAVRHGRARNIDIHMEDMADEADQPLRRIGLQIRDDGHGPQPGSQEGFGLAAMRERILAAGGSLKFERGENGVGTSIQTVIPILANAGTRQMLPRSLQPA